MSAIAEKVNDALKQLRLVVWTVNEGPARSELEAAITEAKRLHEKDRK